MISAIAAAYLLWVAWNQQFEWTVFHALLAALLLCYTDAGASVLWQAWRLLRWLLLPIVVLHAVFTPGAFLMPGWPFTYEGLSRGSWLALHLAALYLSAMLFSRLLSLHVLMRLAAFNAHTKRLMPIYIRLFPAIMRGIQGAIKQHAQQWREQGSKIRQLPTVLHQLVVTMEQLSYVAASQVARNWSCCPVVQAFRIPKQRALWASRWLGVVMLLVYMNGFNGSIKFF
ncbi:MAG: hypothetical protein Q9M22_02945 [Mariprofundaceae bacterium]|nr:hypothetical protein [Mariprofundaceae bacterium]